MKITDMPFENLLKIAEEMGYKPTDPALTDVEGLLAKNQMEMFLIRFAYRIEAEILKSASEAFKNTYDPIVLTNAGPRGQLDPEFCAILRDGLKAPK